MEKKEGVELDAIEEELLRRLEDPNTLRVMNSMLDKMVALDEVTTVLKGLLDSTTSAMVERMMGTVDVLASLGDVLTRPGMQELVHAAAGASESLTRALQKLQRLEESGTLDVLLQAGDLLVGLKNSMSDAMVERVVVTAGAGLEMADAAIQGGAGKLLTAVLRATNDAQIEAEKDTRKIGITGLMGALRDPEMQKGLKVVLALTKNLPKHLHS